MTYGTTMFLQAWGIELVIDNAFDDGPGKLRAIGIRLLRPALGVCFWRHLIGGPRSLWMRIHVERPYGVTFLRHCFA